MKLFMHKLAREFSLVLAFSFLTVCSFSANAQWRPAAQLSLSSIAPPLQLNNLSGKSVDISSLKGKVIVVNFWASWCEPCREEFEELAQLQESYGSQGLVVLAVNLAEMKPRVMQFLKGNGFSENSLEILLDRNSTAYKSWKARGLPTTFLVSKSGKIEGVWIGAIENVDSSEVKGKIESLLRQ
ncbi:TlpA disulfide reductase family protein [Polynucleobacter sp. AP-Kaivos-20-H2]|uniref:TlpA family protein disulfide reductase n=1 Tax=Polynucleobacter sp. AP-Kaivos-20-H2 TaxID=2689104 RepID=UPI001C0BF46F|nr:TlpA disulfide reductase family protein [Polynucleobacter sp. AP-Kaivos-20-H2]MBU3605111.1 TlpA family protein disulfide reductase [Polynucleobacter sp. AP-Kaivos-20-H2]